MLNRDRAEARSQQDPCANLCTLASVDETGAAHARTLILREVGDLLAVFVNATSPKWHSLLERPVAVVVWLPTQQVQYRLNCTTEEIPTRILRESWQLRPDPPKKMDWFYSQTQSQSSEIEDRDALLAGLRDLKLPEPLIAPDTARGLYLIPSVMERLHLGQQDGVHDRRRYTRIENDWVMSVLVP